MSLEVSQGVEEIPSGMTMDQLYANLHDRAVAALLKKGCSMHNAEDAVQEAFTKLVELWPTVSQFPYDRQQGWVITVARNAAVQAHRKNRRLTPTSNEAYLSGLLSKEGRETSAFVGTELDERQGEYHAAVAFAMRSLSELPAEEANILQSVMSGTKQRVLAKEVGVHEATMSRRISGIYQRLRTGLEELGFTEEVLHVSM